MSNGYARAHASKIFESSDSSNHIGTLLDIGMLKAGDIELSGSLQLPVALKNSSARGLLVESQDDITFAE